MRMTQLVVRIPEEQKQMLTLLAQQGRQSVSDVVREAIDGHFLSKRKNVKNELLALAEIGKRYKGKKYSTDLSTNYKRYLYGDKRI